MSRQYSASCRDSWNKTTHEKESNLEKEVIIAIFGSVTTLAVAIGGWAFAWAMQRDAKKRERQQKRIAKLEDEVRARMAEEKSASEWIAELTNKTFQAAMLELRSRTEKTSGLRPQMFPSDLVSKD
jgi:hypothetical protein